MENRPRIFIASTVYDFRDLRSALKYWLEELGYLVQLSEFNDFRHDLDLNSFEACLKVISECDYFILLVGGRVGGWYNSLEGISITRREYRAAYELFLQRRLKLLVFVRTEIWDIKEDRKALESLLLEQFQEEHEISRDDINAIVNHRSKLITDASAVFSFIREVTRAEEMKESISGNLAKPEANWVHTFSSFRDLIDTLRIHFLENRGLRRAVLSANLQYQLALIVQDLATRQENGIVPDYRLAHEARQLPLKSHVETTRVPGNLVPPLILWALFNSRPNRLNTTALLDAAISSGEFLSYDIISASYQLTDIQKMLIGLRNEIEQIRISESLAADARSALLQALMIARTEHSDAIVPTSVLAELLMIADRQENVLKLARAIYRALEDEPVDLRELQLKLLTAFPDQQDRIRRELPSVEEALDWLQRT